MLPVQRVLPKWPASWYYLGRRSVELDIFRKGFLVAEGSRNTDVAEMQLKKLTHADAA